MTAWAANALRRASWRSENGRNSIRRIRITPMGAPSRSRGSASMVRRPRRQARLSGNSRTAAPSTLRMCIVCRSITARPATEPRVTGTVRAGASGPWEAARWKVSPSSRKIWASLASHRRAALSATVFITGSRSPPARLIAPRISAVAACCSSASARRRSSSRREGARRAPDRAAAGRARLPLRLPGAGPPSHRLLLPGGRGTVPRFGDRLGEDADGGKRIGGPARVLG